MPTLPVGEENLGGGLITSYWLEYHDHEADGETVPSVLRSDDWTVESVGGGGLFSILDKKRPVGFAEAVTDRHLLIHSVQPTQETDSAIRRRVSDDPALDFAWLPGSYMEATWRRFVLDGQAHRMTKMKFEYRAHFDVRRDFWDDDPDGEEEFEYKKPSSVTEIREPAGDIDGILDRLQDIHPPFNALSMIRIPSYQARGAYDLWAWGKMTYRSTNFRRGRLQLDGFSRLYQKLVEEVEKRLWLSVDEQPVGEGQNAVRVVGAPFTIQFDRPLSQPVFEKLIQSTFGPSPSGPLRLWGNPLWLGKHRVHVYGIDRHLWQKVHLELTPDGIIAFLPQGTCGNTANRLLTNVQRFVSPGAKGWVGDTPYSDLIVEAWTETAAENKPYEA